MDLLSREEDEAASLNTKPTVCLGFSFSAERLARWLNILLAFVALFSDMLYIPISPMINCMDLFAKTN